MSEHSSSDDGFTNYQEDTVDPGSAFIVATVVVCALLLAIIPVLIWATAKCRRRRRQEQRSSLSIRTDSALSQEHRHRGHGHEDDSSYEEDDDSMISHRSVTTSSHSKPVVSNVMTAILSSTPRAGPHSTRSRANTRKRDKYLQQEEDRNDRALVANHDTSHGSVGTGPEITKSKTDPEDAVSGSGNNTKKGDGVQRIQPICVTRKRKNPWYKPAAWVATYDQFLEIAEYDYEMKRLCKLGAPFAAKALARGICETAKVALIGKFIGTYEVTAYVTVNIVVGLCASLLYGFYESLTTLCSQAIGVGNPKLAGQYVQASIVTYLSIFAPLIVVLIHFMEDILIWFGYDDATVAVGSSYTKIYVFVVAINGVTSAFYALLDTIDLEYFSSFALTVSEVASTAAVLGVALSNNSTLEMVGMALIAVAAGTLIVVVGIIMWKGWCDDYLEGLIGTFAFKDWDCIKLMLTTAASISCGFLLVYAEWELLAVFAKFLGPAEVAAWAMLGTLWDVVEYLTESVSDACEVRVAMLLGAGKPEKAKMSAYKSIYLGMFMAMSVSSILFIMGDAIPTWMTNDPTLQRLLAEMIPLFGIGNIGLTVGTVSWTAVGAQGRYRLSTAVGFAGSWLVTIPLAALFSIYLKIDLQGQTSAIVIGYMASGVVNSYILFTSDWERLSREVIEANGGQLTEEDESMEQSSSSSSSSSSSIGSSLAESSYSSKASVYTLTRQATVLVSLPSRTSEDQDEVEVLPRKDDS